MFIFCECLLGVGLITRSEESYRLWRECDREASIMRSPWFTRGCCAMNKKYGFVCSPRQHSSVNRDEIQIGFLEFDSREHYDYSLRFQIQILSGAHVAPAVCHGGFSLGERNRSVRVTTQFHQQPVLKYVTVYHFSCLKP